MVAPSNQVFTQGSVTPVSADQLNTFVQTVASVASLRTFTGTVGMQVELQGTTGAGTGNAGAFCWNATSTAADDGGNVIAPTGSTVGRWIRNLETASLAAFTVSSADLQNYVTVAPGNIDRAFSSAAPQVKSQYNSNASGGTSGTVAFNGMFYSTIRGAPNEYIWSLFGAVDFNGTGGTGQHVAVTGQGIRRTFAVGGAANNPEIWGSVFQIVDQTNTDSANTNSSVGLELDMNFGNTDSANKRSGIILSLNKNAVTDVNPEADLAIGIFTGSVNYKFHSVMKLWAPFTNAGIDFRSATNVSGHAIWFGDTSTTSGLAHDIAWDHTGNFTTGFDATIFSGAGGIRFKGAAQFDQGFYSPAAITVGGVANLAGAAVVTGGLTVLTDGSLVFANQTNHAAAATATLTNAPTAGNPNFWIQVSVNGSTRYIPAW